MERPVITRRLSLALAGGALVAAMVPASATASPPQIGTHHFYGCEGPAGTPDEFDAVYSLGRARFVVGSNTVWRVWRVVDVDTGEVSLYDMPQPMLDNTQVPLVTCWFDALHSDRTFIATGSFMPAPPSGG
jgi:hypothetical protein